MAFDVRKHYIDGYLFICAVALTINAVRFVASATFRLSVAPGHRECFFEELARGTPYEFRFKVLSGGELDINFYIQAPNYEGLVAEHRQTDRQYKRTAELTGEYSFCMDNTFSLVSNKLVYVELNVQENPTDLNSQTVSSEDGVMVENFDLTVQDFKHKMDGVETKLQMCRHIQNEWSLIELRHRSIQEYNFERVNFWSALQLGIMISASLVNVIVIRRLFHEKRRVKPAVKQQT